MFKLLLSLVLLACSAQVAQAQPIRPTPETFPVEWQPRSGQLRPGVEGYVYNYSEYRVGSVRLKVEVLDQQGRVSRQQFAWVYGSIDAGGRGYFTLPPLKSTETYRIAVESFDLLSRQAP
jgi:hypothetical protein